VTLKKRRDFLAAARARKWAAAGLILQGRERRPGEDADPEEIRVGYTCSRKVGNAVRRNRAKRRLRAAAEAVLPRLGRPGWDYVLIGKSGATEERSFADLLSDLEEALGRVHAPRRRK
jgi:ribonuclease P protein component